MSQWCQHGSANDAAARIFADGLSKRWGKPVVVEDKPGAEGTIGVGSFVSAQDDHTLLYTVAGSVSVAPLLIDKLTYDVDRDLVPIAATTAIVLTLAVSNDLLVDNIPNLLDVLRSNPGKYAWTSGPSLPRYVFASFLKRNGLLMNFISYRDASQPQADLGEGRIQVLAKTVRAADFSATLVSASSEIRSPTSEGRRRSQRPPRRGRRQFRRSGHR
jgi:tripartite-type tricarboxylate transporter receptor subunit TctC